jgi:hypothetical protein
MNLNNKLIDNSAVGVVADYSSSILLSKVLVCILR